MYCPPWARMGKDGQGRAMTINGQNWKTCTLLTFRDFVNLLELELIFEGLIGCGHVLSTMGKDGQQWARAGNDNKWAK